MEGFTLALALVDAIPVLCFGGSMLLISRLFPSPLFLIGAVASFVAGCCKVLWKLLLATAKKDVKWLNKLFLPLQITGTLVMLISLILGWRHISLSGIWAAVTAMPACIFFALGVIFIAAMIVVSRRFDKTDAKANWTAQIINAVAQGSFFVALLLTVVK